MTNYRYNITITEDGFTYTGNYYFEDHFEADDFLTANDHNGAESIINCIEEITHEEFIRHL